MDAHRLIDVEYWVGIAADLHTMAASAPPPMAIGVAVLGGAIYGFLAGLGRGWRRGSGVISEAVHLARCAGWHAGTAMLFFVWILADPSRSIFADPGVELHQRVIDWLAREYSLFGLILALPVTLIIMAAGVTLFLLGATSLVIVPVGAIILIPDIVTLVMMSIAAVVRGLAYVLVRHPAARVVLPALHRDHAAIDATAFSRALAPSRRSLSHPPPRFISERQRRKAEALESKLIADTRLAQAMIERERARAALIDAKQRVHALRPRFWRST